MTDIVERLTLRREASALRLVAADGRRFTMTAEQADNLAALMDREADTIEQLRARIAEMEGQALVDQNEIANLQSCEYDVAKAVLAEREACARMVEDMGAKLKISPVTALYTAAAIRERTDGR